MAERCLRILQVLPRLDVGGAERVAVEICEAVVRAGQQAVIAAEAGTLVPAAIRAGATLVTLPLASKWPGTIWRNGGRLARLIAAQRIDLVHAHSRAPAWSALWAAQRMKIPLVTTYHGSYSETVPFKRQYNSVMAAGDRVIAVSEFIGRLIASRYQVGERLRVIPGGVDMVKFDPAAVPGGRVARLARAWRLPAAAPTIMLPGRLTSWKGQAVLIQALALLRHSDAVVVLVGAGQGRERYARGLIARAAALGVAERLRIVGHVEDMPAALMLADIVVNASTDPEAFGRTIVEAQAMGRMVIAAGHGGASETVVDGQTGLLVPPGDAAALAAAIDHALDLAPAARIAWGRRVREAVGARYSIAAMQAAVLAVYGELL